MTLIVLSIVLCLLVAGGVVLVIGLAMKDYDEDEYV